MKAKELIAKLSKFDPDMEVMIYDRGMEFSTFRGPYLQTEEVVDRILNCRDAFDYGEYTTKAIQRASRDEKGRKVIVLY